MGPRGPFEPLPPSLTDVPLVRRFFQRAEAEPDALMLAVHPRGALVPSERISWGGMAARVRALAAHLLHRGVQRGDRVAILAGNRPVWPAADLAVQSLGAIAVGLPTGLTDPQVDHLLRDSGARVLFTDDQRTAERLATAPAAGMALEYVVFDVHGGGGDTLPHGVIGLHVFADDGATVLHDRPALGVALDGRLDALRADDLAALIYTSGSTGEQKGACISHRYLAASAASIASVLGMTAADRGLSFLPYAHAAERVFGHATRLLTGSAAALVEDASDLFAVASRFQPTVFGALPRIFERLDDAAQRAAQTGGSAQQAVIERIGSQVRVATSGGAALPVPVAQRLEALGLCILGAYGQTEHLCVAMNRRSAPRFDCVGPAMPGTEVRVAPDGELLVRRSALTFSGYWHREAETAAAFTSDGEWLRTGDLATIDGDGVLRITGRCKDLIALSTGRKVAPAPIEAALAATPYIAHAVCHGEGRPYLSALVTLRQDAVTAWARAHGFRGTWPALAQDAVVRPLLEVLVQDTVRAVNTALSRTDRVQRVAVLPLEFTTTNGLLTSTFKVRRAEVDTRFAAVSDTLYGRTVPAATPRDDAPFVMLPEPDAPTLGHADATPPPVGHPLPRALDSPPGDDPVLPSSFARSRPH